MLHKIVKIKHLLIAHVAILLTFSSCSFFKNKIGDNSHSFKRRPTKVVWLQIPGLSINHFALSKLNGSILESNFPLESAVCTGKAWNYSLYELSPSANTSIELQLSGSRNSKTKCTERDFVWKDLLEFGFTSGIYLRNQTKSLDMNEQNSCIQRSQGNVAIWRGEPSEKKGRSKEQMFHYLERNKKYFLNYTYFDKSCNGERCHSELGKNISTIYEDFFKKRDFFLFNIQDHSYKEYLLSGNYTAAKEYLEQINGIISYFKNANDQNLLLLFSFIEPIELEFPHSGKKWKTVIKNIRKSKASMQSEVVAFGASSEKFCGIYNASDIKRKILQGVSFQ